MKKVLERKLRRATIEQLSVLNALAQSSSATLTTSKISNSTSTSDKSLGGVLSSLSRMKVDEHPLIMPAGRDREEGLRWQLNQNLIDKHALKELLNEILTNTRQYA